MKTGTAHCLFFSFDHSVSIDGRIIDEVALLSAEVAGIAFYSEDFVVDYAGHDTNVVAGSVLIPVEEYEVTGFRGFAHEAPLIAKHKPVGSVAHDGELRCGIGFKISALVFTP